MKAPANYSIPHNEQLFYHANFLLPYSGAGTGIIRALDEGVEMNFVNDEQIHEFIITIPRKVEDELANEPAKDESNQVKEPNRDKSNQVEGESNHPEGESNHAEESGYLKSNQVEDKSNEADDANKDNSNQVKRYGKVTKKQKDILNFCSVPRSAQEIMDRIGIDNQTNNRKRYIQALIDLGYLMPLFPESMTASNQKYVKVKKDKS